MSQHKLFDGEYRFVSIVWETEPVNSTELVKICLERLGWKKSTTYTVLKKLCERGVVMNENATVTSLVSREEVQRYESGAVIDKTFNGSLPAFVAAFLKDRQLTDQEASEIEAMIREARER